MANANRSHPITRPDPDQLIEQLREEKARASKGRLRIYFGANAGVGKTYAMLAAAQRLHTEGGNLLVGVVETHGRSETAALLAGLPHLPLRAVAYRNNTLYEFDLDAALAARPAVLLVDELAHSNVAGSRHPKRWQDVQELLDAGIEVWTALNVQHLESLNGTVGTITGVRIHETVPDTLLDAADELVLVDATPDELTARLKAGKVYIAPQAERAAQNFFRKGNLIALREIALRRTAEHVEDDVRTWRVEQSVPASLPAPAWNTSGAILCCVGPHDGGEQAVRKAARLAGQLNVQWYAAYVETPRLQRLPAAARDQILAVLALAEQLGATTAVLAHSDVATALVQHAEQENCATFVVGRHSAVQGRARWSAWLRTPHLGRTDLARQLARHAPTLDVVEAGHTASVRRLTRPLQQPEGESEAATAWRLQWPGYAWAVAACVGLTLLLLPLVSAFELVNIVMVFLVGVVLVAVKFGRGPAAAAALLNVAAFDFFFVAPRWSFSVNDAQYLVTFAVMLGVGLLIGQMTGGLRFQARIAAGRERRAHALFELSRDLSAALLTRQVTELGQAAVQRSFGGDVYVMAAGSNDQLAFPAAMPPDLDTSIADWVFHNAQPAGLATTTLSANAWHYVPLKAPMRVRGVLAFKPAQPRWLFIPEQLQQLDTLARQIAIALERVHYVDIAQQALVQMESERLRNTLLAAMSHDVRTPLTALVGLAESLQATPLSDSQHHTVQAMALGARQLDALVTNLLDMARLQSGAVQLRTEWQSVEEVVGSAIRAARHALRGMAVQTDIPASLPLVEFDAALMERVLVNLLENASKYGAEPLQITCRAAPQSLQISVRDHGAGLPAVLLGREHTLFDKFTRGEAESATPGVGLGLAICREVVAAHGGSISAANAQGGGAEFTINLPRTAAPETAEVA